MILRAWARHTDVRSEATRTDATPAVSRWEADVHIPEPFMAKWFDLAESTALDGSPTRETEWLSSGPVRHWGAGMRLHRLSSVKLNVGQEGADGAGFHAAGAEEERLLAKGEYKVLSRTRAVTTASRPRRCNPWKL